MTVVKINKQKTQKSVSQEENLSLKIIKNYLEAIKLENKIKYVQKNKININSLKKS